MKIRGINLIIIFILAIINSFAFPKAIYAAWSRTYGGFNYDWASSIQQTSDGGFIAAGGTDSFGGGSYDFWVVKLDSAGDIQWEKAYGGVNTEQAFYIQQTNDGGYIVIGFTNSFGAGSDDIWILKLDSSGNIQWQKAYGGVNNDDGLSIKQTNDGGYIALGYTESFGAGLRDLWVLKLDANGDIIWQKTYGGSNNDEGNLIQQTNDGGYIIVGDTKSFGSGAWDLWVLKLDSAGSIQWQKLYGGPDDEWGIAISQTNDSDYIVAGSTRSFGSGLWDIWILKLNSSGAIQWQKTYGTSVYEEATFIQQTNDNGFIISGYYFAAGANPLDYLILKLDQLGNIQWQKIYSGADWDFPFSIQQTGNGYIVAGITYSAGQASSDMWILSLYMDGSINSSCSFIYDYSASVNSSSAIPINSNAIISDSAAAPTSTAAIVNDTNANMLEQCSSGIAWSRNYSIDEYEWANSIQQTNDGGYIVAGYTYPTNGGDAWVLKLNAYGAIQWQKRFGGLSLESAHSLSQTSDGGYIIAGSTNSYGAGGADFWLIKLDTAGNVQWQKAYGNINDDTAFSVQQTNDGGYIVAGDSWSFGAEYGGIWVLKLDPIGNIEWEKMYDSYTFDYAYSIRQTKDGGYIIAGKISYGAGITDFLIIKLDSTGNIQWQKTYGGLGWEEAHSIQQTNDDGYIVAGTTDSFGAGSSDAWVLKLDLYGDIQWQKTYGGINPDDAFSVQQTKDGAYVVGGLISSSDCFSCFSLLKLDNEGNIIWQKSYNALTANVAYSIQQTNDNGYVMAGQTWSEETSYDFRVIKVNDAGNISASCTIVYDTSAIVMDTAITPSTISLNIFNTSAIVSSTASIGIDTNAIVREQCSTACSLQPLNNQKPLVNDSGSPTANNLFEPAETAELFSTLQNIGDDIASSIIGNLATDDPTININQPNATYPYLNPGSSGACTICYSLTPQAVRPATHWDFLVSDNISASGCGPFIYYYTYHVGESFEDVPPTNLFYKYIEALLHYSLTGGCTSMSYCPSSEVERQQMAKFICLAMEAARQNSCPAMGCGGIFSDVPYTNIFCKFIEELYYLGIVGGCQSNPMLYCPASFTDREAMAKFICLAMNNVLEGSCPTSLCTGIFADVSSNNIFCPYIEALYNIKIVGGCQSNPLLYCPYDNVSREQMAKYLINAFGLPL